MEYKDIRVYDAGDQVSVIELNHPEKLNALTDYTWEEIVDALKKIEMDDTVNAVLFKGAGKSFCAGFDIGESTKNGNSDAWGQWLSFKRSDECHNYLWDFPKPTVFAVQGYCLGGGFELASLGDFVVCSEDAVFGETELRFCLTPGTRDVFLLGLRNAKEIMMLAEKFSAQDALRLGVVSRVFPVDKLDTEALKIAKKLAKMPTETMQLTKHMLNKVTDIQGMKIMGSWSWDTFLAAKLIVPKVRQEFNKIGEEQGMKAAFKWLNDRYDD
ncbi:enoyl-CoA hydratase/isomerase family protein [uncultured Dysosmobacter sp.]|uniref:enoyl-CoA hydratase/isomerase family protein n=1 Tax=uncultured Dysosmobacter sp. TaxID=2591384 RepID=UPI002622ED66|nr:enoyl-CoA hydratase/isomerase family protein [uncultured Dysosmobacter sp.]